jgi:hypothetical protein
MERAAALQGETAPIAIRVIVPATSLSARVDFIVLSMFNLLRKGVIVSPKSR